MAKRKLTSARLLESVGYSDSASDPTTSHRVRVQRNGSSPPCSQASLTCVWRPAPQFRILTLCPNPTSSLPPPYNPHSPATRVHKPARSQGPLQLPRPARLLKGASRLSARAEPGSSLSSPPRGVCDSPHFSRPGAQAVTSTDKPNLYGPVYLTHFPSSCSLTDSILKCFLSAWSRTV